MALTEKFLNTKEDITYYSAKEAGITIEQMELIEKHFWKAFNYYISHPHLVKDYISLDNFLMFHKKNDVSLFRTARKKFLSAIKSDNKELTERFLILMQQTVKEEQQNELEQYKKQFKEKYG